MAPALIAVMGATGTGKSTFINLVSGSNFAVGEGLQSCTSTVEISDTFWFEGTPVQMIDTPGFDDTTRTDSDVLKEISDFLAASYEKNQRLNGIIYMYRISDVRMGGIALRNFRMFRMLCGDSSLENVVIVTNMWTKVSPEVGAARERELKTDRTLFKPALDKGAQMRRHYNVLETAHDILRLLVDAPPATLRIQDELVNQGRTAGQSAAGAELQRELREENRRHERAMERARREGAEAMAARDRRARIERERAIEWEREERRRARLDYRRMRWEREQEMIEEEERADRIAQRRYEAEMRYDREQWHIAQQARQRRRDEDSGCIIC